MKKFLLFISLVSVSTFASASNHSFDQVKPVTKKKVTSKKNKH